MAKKLAFIIPVVSVSVFGLIWFYSLIIGALNFNSNNTISILSSIIQGMSALLSVAIAVAIFRVQSLENRNQALEQSTLNYIAQISQFVYPQWIPALEQHIEDGGIADRYIAIHKKRAGTIGYTPQDFQKERDNQQERLMATLKLHRVTESKIAKSKVGTVISTIILMLPIVSSLLLLMVSDSLGVTVNYLWVSFAVYLSVFAISFLIAVIANSTMSE